MKHRSEEIDDLFEVSETELHALQERLSRESREPQGPTLRDVAEGFDVPIDEVRRALIQIRTEQTARQTPRLPMVPIALSLVVLAGIAYSLLSNVKPEVETTAPAPRPIRKAKPPNEFATQVIQRGPYAPPKGFGFELAGFYRQLVAESLEDEGPLPPGVVKARLKRSLDALTVKLAASERSLKNPGALPEMRFLSGNAVRPIDGFIQVSGVFQGYLPAYPIGNQTEEEVRADRKRRLDRSVDGIVDRVFEEQMRQLSTAGDVDILGTVTPPPGYSVIVEGRRSTNLHSSPLVFAPISESQIAARLLYALETALAADLKPTPERRRQDAEKEAAIPTPPFSRITIGGPESRVEFEVPTGPSTNFPTAADVARERSRLLKEKAREAASQMRPINERALKEKG